MTPASDDYPWIHSLDIDKLLQEHEAADKSTRRRDPSVYRVPPFIRRLKPEIYNASFLPMGLYNRDFKRVTAVDNLKLEVLTCILAHLKIDQQQWKTFCKEVATQPSSSLTPDVEYFYEDDGTSYSCLTLDSVQSILVIDAFFIAALFIWRLEPESEGEGKWVSDDRPRFIWHIMRIFYRGSVESSIHAFDRDICWLCEGQIPLFLIRNVWERIASVAEIDDFDTALRSNLQQTLTNSGLLYKDPMDEDINFDTCDYLLECLHRSLSHWSSSHEEEEQEQDEKGEKKDEVENSEDDTDDKEKDEDELTEGGNEEKEGLMSHLRKLVIVTVFLKFVEKMVDFAKGLLRSGDDETRYTLPSAIELAKMGIRFRGVDGSLNDFQFEKSLFRLRATLEIPKMHVADFTEKMLLNMCVYESMTRKIDGVHDYLLFMDELIDSKEDVDLLMEGKNPVITANGLGDTHRVAEIFSNPVQNFHFSSETDERITDARDAILDWCNKPWRRHVVEFIDRFRLQPWLLVSLLAATLLLVLTVLQTIYTIWGFYRA